MRARTAQIITDGTHRGSGGVSGLKKESPDRVVHDLQLAGGGDCKVAIVPQSRRDDRIRQERSIEEKGCTRSQEPRRSRILANIRSYSTSSRYFSR
jgi:hypothetical protein